MPEFILNKFCFLFPELVHGRQLEGSFIWVDFLALLATRELKMKFTNSELKTTAAIKLIANK